MTVRVRLGANPTLERRHMFSVSGAPHLAGGVNVPELKPYWPQSAIRYFLDRLKP